MQYPVPAEHCDDVDAITLQYTIFPPPIFDENNELVPVAQYQSVFRSRSVTVEVSGNICYYWFPTDKKGCYTTESKQVCILRRNKEIQANIPSP